MNNSPIKVITFDLDDTLWAIQPVLIKAEQQVYNWLSEHAPKLTAQFSPQDFMHWRIKIYQQQPELAHQITRLRLVAVKQAMLNVGYDEKLAQRIAEQAFDIFIQARHDITFFDTAEPMLAALHPHYSLGALSNGNADIFKLEMGRFFDFAFSAEQLNASKPAPEQFLAAQSYGNTQPQQMIHIGDNHEHDIAGAIAAGWHSIWFNPSGEPYAGDTASQQGPTREVSCLSDIPAAISSIAKDLRQGV
ncbi:HAD family hydrolase [Oceanicoccus sagamiensis]|uniref:HAD family hydrolase n=1 Tax=Oceanicoccus sagamiensis TaxID=716816 RepID=A0A1X9NAF5_9GAMM|nr:HAD-IA family hydrolase [Oceanicoccus sagamiensis]ARN74141.1 hypothetical protein BST96_08410 [Oceanicoccus sagamiensis]